MATTNTKWNGVLLGGAFGGLFAFFVQGKVNVLWSGVGTLSEKIISLWSGFSGFSNDVMSYLIFILVGIIIGLYVEMK